MKMSNSERKMDVSVKRMPKKWGSKFWAIVTMKKSNTWYPSFHDLYRIIRAISYCEEKKYPDGKGRKMVAEFLWDCVFIDDWLEVAKKYNIPIRDGEKVIDDNGAKL